MVTSLAVPTRRQRSKSFPTLTTRTPQRRLRTTTRFEPMRLKRKRESNMNPTWPRSRAWKRLALAVILIPTLAACSHQAGTLQPPEPSATRRNLPPAPSRLAKPPPLPQLDKDCTFPWFGIAGCKGKDTTAMLRLTVSDDIELRNQVGALPAWYQNVRRIYGAK